MTHLILPLVLSLSIDLPSEVQRLRPTLIPSPALDSIASDILARAKAARPPRLPTPGAADVGDPGFSRILQCCTTGTDGPKAVLQRLRAGAKSGPVLRDAGATHFGTARLPGPAGGVLWCVVLGQAKSLPPSPEPNPLPPPPAPGPQPPPDGPNFVALDLIDRHNLERARAGLAALRPNAALQKAAQAHADDLARTGGLSHTGSDGSDVAVRVARQNYRWTALGENAAAGQTSAAQVVAEWLNSPGHRANLLGRQYTEIGAAVSGTKWVVVFGAPAGGSREGARGVPVCPPGLEAVVRPSPQSQTDPASLPPSRGLSPASAPASPASPVLSIHDGDTFLLREIVLRLSPASIRLAGLDAPEIGQAGPWAGYARHRLAAHLGLGPPRVDVLALESYGRPLAVAWDARGEDIGVDLVATGLAYAWVPAGGQRPPDWAELQSAQRWAQATGVGVWSDPGAVRPWEWRAGRR